MNQFQSNALWPAGVCPGMYGNNISSDVHGTEEMAKAVCAGLERDGFGGQRQHFPIATWVSSIQECPIVPAVVVNRLLGVIVERDNAWTELRNIRAAIGANPEEATIDEVSRLVARLTELSEKGKAVVIQRDKAREQSIEYSRIIHDLVVIMQAAWIEWEHGRGAEYAMGWIHNTLAGPGHIPDEDAPYGKEAQAWYDANQSKPFPTCFCGRPSNILSKGKGYCSQEHLCEYEAKNFAEGEAK